MTSKEPPTQKIIQEMLGGWLVAGRIDCFSINTEQMAHLIYNAIIRQNKGDASTRKDEASLANRTDECGQQKASTPHHHLRGKPECLI